MAVSKKTVKTASKASASSAKKDAKKSAPAKKSTVKVTEKSTVKPAAKTAKKAAAKSTPAAKKTDKKVAKATSARSGAGSAKKVTVASTSKKVAQTTTKTTMKKNESAEKKTTKAVSKPEKVSKKAAPVKEKAAVKKTAKPEPKAVKAKVEEAPAPAPKAEKKKAAPSSKPVVIPELSTKAARKYEPEFTKSVLDQPESAISSGPVLRYSDSDLLEFKELILKKLDQAKQELSYLQGLITRKDSMGGDETENRYMTMEDGSMSMEREQLAQMASRQINYIDHLEKALMRIENKTYGVCRVTGKLIDKARLKAVPHATLSIEAKQSMNR